MRFTISPKTAGIVVRALGGWGKRKEPPRTPPKVLPILQNLLQYINKRVCLPAGRWPMRGVCDQTCIEASLQYKLNTKNFDAK